eukprot:365728-Chlamydomonas_euryale.AAC.14
MPRLPACLPAVRVARHVQLVHGKLSRRFKKDLRGGIRSRLLAFPTHAPEGSPITGPCAYAPVMSSVRLPERVQRPPAVV